MGDRLGTPGAVGFLGEYGEVVNFGEEGLIGPQTTGVIVLSYAIIAAHNNRSNFFGM